jgi:hypothetical protein
VFFDGLNLGWWVVTLSSACAKGATAMVTLHRTDATLLPEWFVVWFSGVLGHLAWSRPIFCPPSLAIAEISKPEARAVGDIGR